MAEITKLSQLLSGVSKQIDLTSNTLVFQDIKIGGASGTLLTKTILDNLVAHESASSGVHGVTGDVVGTTDTQTLSAKTLTSPVLNTGVSGTAVLDDDTMATASNTTLATSESIKAYVDANAGGSDVINITSQAEQDALTSPVENKIIHISTANITLTHEYNNCRIYADGVGVTIDEAMEGCIIKSNNTVTVKVLTVGAKVQNCDINCVTFNFDRSGGTSSYFNNNRIQSYYFRHTFNDNLYTLDWCTIDTYTYTVQGTNRLAFRYGQLNIRDLYLNDSSVGTNQVSFGTSSVSINRLTAGPSTTSYITSDNSTIDIGYIEDADFSSLSNKVRSGTNSVIKVGYFEVTTSVIDAVPHTAGDTDITHYQGADASPAAGDPDVEVITISTQAQQDALVSPVENKIIFVNGSHNVTKTFKNCHFTCATDTLYRQTVTTGKLLNCTVRHNGILRVNGDCEVKHTKIHTERLELEEVTTTNNFRYNDVHCWGLYIGKSGGAAFNVTDSTFNVTEWVNVINGFTGAVTFTQCHLTTWKLTMNQTSSAAGISMNRGVWDIGYYECAATATGKLTALYGTMRIGQIVDSDVSGKNNLIEAGSDGYLEIGHLGVDTSIIEGNAHKAGEKDITYYEGTKANTQIKHILLDIGDESTDLTTGTAKKTFRMPIACTLIDIRASVNTAPVGTDLQIDINEGGVSILSTILSIDDGEKTSTTAATPLVISDSAIADDAEITIDIDQVGSTTAGKGLKLILYYIG